jgi:ABC-type Na+ transport system ATPase subunit NatA
MDRSLEVQHLVKTYHPGLFQKPVQVLRGLSFEVRSGEVFGFLGPNGAGKTTAIKAITGLINLDQGEIRVFGLDHRSMDAKRRVGFMPESAYYYHHLTGREYLRFFGRLLGLSGGDLEARIDSVLDTVAMSDRADRPMRTFSKGMLQRVALGQALLGDPGLLILDEPMSGLDPVGTAGFPRDHRPPTRRGPDGLLLDPHSGGRGNPVRSGGNRRRRPGPRGGHGQGPGSPRRRPSTKSPSSERRRPHWIRRRWSSAPTRRGFGFPPRNAIA